MLTLPRIPPIATVAPAFALFVGLGFFCSQAFGQLALESRLVQEEKWADADRPLQLRVMGGLKYDSNLFRLSDGVNSESAIDSSHKDDFIYRLGAAGRYEIDYSRQKFLVEGAVEGDHYQRFDNLDNLSDNVRGEWLWQAGNSWNGTLGVGQRRYLSGFTDVQQNIKDMINENRAYGSANYLVNSHLKLSADLTANDVHHGADSRDSLNSKSNTEGFTVNWITPGQNTVGLRFQTSDVRYPIDRTVAGVAVGNDYTDNEYSIVGHWFITGASDLVGRVGRVQRRFDEASNRDFGGTTWRLTYHWQANGKFSLDSSLWRELTGFEDLTSNYARTTGISVQPMWSLTPQTAIQGKAAYQQRKYLGDPGIVAFTQQREDHEQLYQIAFIWTPARLTDISFAVETGKRTSNQLLADYDYQSVAITATRSF